MVNEMMALHENGTQELVSLSLGQSFVGCCWVLTMKYLPDGTTKHYMERLVDKGYSQTYGVDYAENFSLVAKIEFVHILTSLAVLSGLDFS